MADSNRRTISQDDSLPPVEPPNAAFLVQLFLVPGVIVAIIVCVWLAFHWLAHLGSDPQAYVKTLRRDNEGRWQAALNLANDLRGPGGGALKEDESLATELGRILTDEAASGRSGEQSQTLRLYLCRALGEFAIPAAAGPLVERASVLSDPQTARAAVEALAVLSTNLLASGRSFDDAAGVTSAVVAASLTELSGDSADDVRFNAALALARQGREESLETLAEMLALPDVSVAAGDAVDVAAQSRRYKRALVVVNALRGLALLVDATHEPPPRQLLDRVEQLTQDPVGDVRSSAAALLKKVERLSKPAS